MIICVPIEVDKGLHSIPYSHFESAPFFVICNLEKQELKIIKNNDIHHHANEKHLKTPGGEKIDAVLVDGIGTKTLVKLNNQGIQVYRVTDKTVLKNIELFKRNELAKIPHE